MAKKPFLKLRRLYEDEGRWKACEIVKICKVLHIPQEQIGAYFFPAIAKEEKTA